MRAAARYVVLIAVLAAAGTARADDVDAARKLFGDGVKLFQQGDYEGARRLFKKADAEHHAPPIVYNLALAEERLGHPQAAVAAYEAYLGEVGDSGELSAAATVALAQTRARSTKLRIDAKPAGGRLFVDGLLLEEPAPTTWLVAAGHHLIVAQGDGWRDEKDVEVRGVGDTLGVTLEAPLPVPATRPGLPAIAASSAGEASAAPPASAAAPSPRDATPAEPGAHGPDGFVWGASFAIAPYYLASVNTPGAANAGSASSIIAGPFLEAGVALTDRLVFLARGFAALGPDGKPTYAYMGGPGLSVRIGSLLWLGATFTAGQLETLAQDARTATNTRARYGTDLVFGALFEAGVVVVDKPEGQWIAALQPGFLLTELRNDNRAFFVPVSFGYRGF